MAKKKKQNKKREIKETIDNIKIQNENTTLHLSSEELLAIEKDKNLRLFAEFENFRKRTARERIELSTTAHIDIMTALLPILDNFERSIIANNYSDEDGTVLIFKQLKSELEKINKNVKHKFANQNNFNQKIDELNQETETLMEEIEKWQT